MGEFRAPFRKAIGVFAIVFGAASIFAGGGVLFGGETTRTLAGNVVPVVLWFNFLAGFGYIAAGVGIYAARSWAPPLSAVIAAASVCVFALFGFQVIAGAAYEMRTVWAMTFRCVIWIAIAFIACRACLQAHFARG